MRGWSFVICARSFAIGHSSSGPGHPGPSRASFPYIHISGRQLAASVQENAIFPSTPRWGDCPGSGSIDVSQVSFQLPPHSGDVTPFEVGLDRAFHLPSQMAFQKPFNLPFILAFKRRLDFRPDLCPEVFPVVFSVVSSLVSSPARSLVCSPCPPAAWTLVLCRVKWVCP